MDVKQQLKTAIASGKVSLGFNKTAISILHGNPKLVIVSSNCPRFLKESIAYYCRLADHRCITLKATSIEMGSICGRPHPISALSILDEGESAILEVRE